MAEKRITLRDIAQATGFTPNTVSRALKNAPALSEKTRLLIQRTAREMGYTPNRAATALRSGRTRMLALIVADLINPFFGMLYDATRRAADALGYTVTLFASYDQPDSELQAIREAVSYGAEGILLVPCQMTEDSVLYLEEKRIPYALLMREFPGRQDLCLVADELSAGHLAARHLIESGCRRFAYIGDRRSICSIRQRQEGFLSELTAQGFSARDCLTCQNGATVTDSPREARAAAELLAAACRQNSEPLGVGVFCDLQARHLMAACRSLGLKIPEDIRIVGFDNLDDLSPSPLPICSVGCDAYALCQNAVAALDGLLTGHPPAERRQVFPVFLQCRGSCSAEKELSNTGRDCI